jgi:hypothetical protein
LVFPELLSRRVGNRYFNLSSCAFGVRREKAGTARVAFWRQLRHWDVFTFEASFAGSTLGDMRGQHFHPCHYEDMGARFAETIRELARFRRDQHAQQLQHMHAEQARVLSSANDPASGAPVVSALPST